MTGPITGVPRAASMIFGMFSRPMTPFSSQYAIRIVATSQPQKRTPISGTRLAITRTATATGFESRTAQSRARALLIRDHAFGHGRSVLASRGELSVEQVDQQFRCSLEQHQEADQGDWRR